MENKIILVQIVKNEEHVICRMLDSLSSFVHGVVIVDTGSTDSTKEKIKEWSSKTGIHSTIVNRDFDDFASSRNAAIAHARSLYPDTPTTTYYGFWLDADETLSVSPKFSPDQLDKDIYMIRTRLNKMVYTRNELFKLHKPFKFYGPVHEYLVCDLPDMTSAICPWLEVNVNSDGASWKSNLSHKYFSHAQTLEKFVQEDNDPRWLFYLAQSYHDSATTDSDSENTERLRRSIFYYKQRADIEAGHFEERWFSVFKIGVIMDHLKADWDLCKQQYLKAYSMDPYRAEPIKAIIDHYLKVKDYPAAYLYAKFAYTQFHNKTPNRTLFLESQLYEWKIMEVYAATLVFMANKKEASELYKRLISLTKTKASAFSDADIQRLQDNKKFFTQ